jgi:dynein heavy chain
LQDEFQILKDRLDNLNSTYNRTMKELKAYKDELDDLQIKIDRGDKLINGLQGEKMRWEATIIDLDECYVKLVGDCILSAAFMSYCGPFPSEFRDNLISNWIATTEVHEIPFSKKFDFADFMAG